MPKKSEPPILKTLAQLYEQERPRIKPAYPYNRKTDKIHLPDEVVTDLKFLLLAGNKVAAIKRVAELTGAGLRISKDYVDALEKQVKP
jgi:ribosomal protein L7/L12